MRALGMVLLMTIAHGTAHGQHRHGNPEDLDAYVAALEDPSRDAWQKPDEVLRAIGIEPGASVCDVGAGPGYFALRMSRLVGARGHVFAVDVEPRILDRLRARLEQAKLRNVTPVLATGDDALLPPSSCDVILIADTYHHFPDGVEYLRRLSAALKPGGRVVNIDFHKRPLPVGPPPEHKIAREDFVAQARHAGFDVVAEPTFLPYQYFLVLRRHP